jgi:urease accessory protein
MTPTEDAALLTLTQWLSPAFPTGAFAYSHGLEQAIAAGDVHDPATLTHWLNSILRHGSGRADAILLARAMDEDTDPDALDTLARALAPSAERLRETLDQGAAFAATAAALTATPMPPRAHPVAVGTAARSLGLAPATVAALWLQAFAANLVAAAVRFVPLGQTEGQLVLARLAPIILEVATEAAAAPLEAIGTAALGADLAAMRHETMDVRIFRT